MFRSILGVLILLVLVIGGAVAWMGYYALSPSKSPHSKPVIVYVERGMSPVRLSNILEEKGVISDAGRFRFLGRVLRLWPKVKRGEYRFDPEISPIGVFSILTSGISVTYPITIREGENMYQVADRLNEGGFAQRERVLELCRDPSFIGTVGIPDPSPQSLEGYLYPDTYSLNHIMSPEEILRAMVKRWRTEWGEKDEARAKELGFTRHEIMTLASIIEKETGAAFERPVISSVFHNRLKKRMRLQSDPTIIYGIWEKYDGNIRRKDIRESTPYNTYTINRLPPGPIGNPGRESIQAALHPEQTDFLYFVSKNDGTHIFTRSYAEHHRAVREYQINRSSREGKSWRDLKQ